MKKHVALYILLIALVGYGIAITVKFNNAKKQLALSDQEITTLRSQLKYATYNVDELKQQLDESIFRIDSLMSSK